MRIPSNHFTEFINMRGQTTKKTLHFIYLHFSSELEATSYHTSHEGPFGGFVSVEKPGFRVAPFRRSLDPGGRELSTVSFFRQISDTIPNERYEPPANPSNRAWIGAVSKLTATRWDWPLQTPRVS